MWNSRAHWPAGRSRLVVSAGVFALGLSLSSAPLPAQAASRSTPVSVDLPALSPFDKESAAAYAGDNGLTIAESELLFEQSRAFHKVLEQIRKIFPKQYSEAVFRVPGETYGYVAFKGDVPLEAVQILKTLPFEIRGVDDTPLGEVERGKAASAGLAKFSQLFPSDTSHAGIEPRSNTLEITYQGSASNPTPDVEKEVLSAARAVLPKTLSSSLSLSVSRVDEPVAGNEVLSGGTALGEGASGGLECTSAFTVKNLFGGTGLLTAGHCVDFLNYERRNILRFEGTAEGRNLDAQWNSSTREGVWNRFIYSNSGGVQLATVNRVEVNSVGDPVCHFGWSTGRGCKPVVATQQSDTVKGIQKDDLIYVDSWITQGGDSGGPWYQGNGGKGVHSGYGYYKFKKRSSYTPLTSIQAKTNLRVITS